MGLGCSIVGCLSAPLSLTVNVEPEVTLARRDYCNADSHHFNIDSVVAKGVLEAFFSLFFLALFRAFLRQKLRIMGQNGSLRVPRRDRELFSGYWLIYVVFFLDYLHKQRRDPDFLTVFFNYEKALFQIELCHMKSLLYMKYLYFMLFSSRF